MSSGQPRVVLNTRERTLSTDHNRIQSLVARHHSQLLRARYNNTRQNSYVYPGVSVENSGGEVPLSADVYDGLMADPQTTGCQITPGILGCIYTDPDATSDDSPYFLIDDPGIQSNAVLTFTANGSGQTRIDIIECQPVEVTLESDSRDIFAPVTGLFTPTSVPKVKTFQLQYRIRTGTPGSGMPNLVIGWLPLAVIVVPTAAANFTTCDFYDVRPLVEDRVEAQPGYVHGTGFVTEQHFPVRSEYFSTTTGAGFNIYGYSESQFGGYRAGGWLRRSSPSSTGSFTGGGDADGDPDFVNLFVGDNQVPGFTSAPNRLVYLVAFFPAGLPRWVRYSHSAVGGGFGRIPKGPRGILKATTAAPLRNGLALPQTIGSGFIAGDAGVVLGVTAFDSAGSLMTPVNANAGLHSIGSAFTLFNQATASSTTVDFSLTDGADYPSSASEILAIVSLSVTNSNSTPQQFQILTHLDAGGVNKQWVDSRTVVVPGGVLNYLVEFTCRVPLIARDAPTSAGGPSTTVRCVCSSTGSVTFVTTANAQKLYPTGWRLGNG